MTGETGASRHLIRGGRIYDHDGDIHQPAIADVLVHGATIERIAPHIAPEPGVEVLDATGKLVIPGFVNAHYQSHDGMAKGLFEELPFDVWMMHSNPKGFGRRSHEEVRLRTLIGAAESLRNGITTIQDFLTVEPQEEAYVDTVLSAYAEAGIRVVFAIAARDRGALDIAQNSSGALVEHVTVFGEREAPRRTLHQPGPQGALQFQEPLAHDGLRYR